MNTLELADWLDDLFDADGEPKQASAELRRLHAINAELLEENKNLRICAKKYIGWIGIAEPDICLDLDLKDPEMIEKAKQ